MTLRSSLTIYLLDYHRAVPHEYPMSNKKRLRNFSKPLIYWSWREDSNPRPADYKSAALPTELRQRCDAVSAAKSTASSASP